MGFLIEGEDGNKSYVCGGCACVRAPRLVVLSFVGLLDVEESKIEESNLCGGCARVRAPRLVALLSRIQLVCEVGQAKGKAAKICSQPVSIPVSYGHHGR